MMILLLVEMCELFKHESNQVKSKLLEISYLRDSNMNHIYWHILTFIKSNLKNDCVM